MLSRADLSAALEPLFTMIAQVVAASELPALLSVFRADRERVAALGKAAGSALRLHGHLQRHPITSTAGAAESTGLSGMTCGTILRKLQAIQAVREITGGQYRRLYAYDPVP